jgi:subtilisin family serine protease
MKRIFSNFITLIALSAILFAAAAPAAAAPRVDLTVPNESGIYIVEMADAPVVVNTGNAAGMKGTQPAEGTKVDPLNADVMSYVAYLNDSHDSALKAIGGGQKLYDYNYTFNGFAAELTSVQAAKMASLPGVLAVTPDELVTMDTSSTPTFLGLDASNGLWKQLGGVDNAGEGVIIGVIDSGIWPESASFSDLSRPHGHSKHGEHHDYHIPGWHGKCVSGQDFSKSLCNNKLIGAQWFNAAWGGDAALAAERPWEFMSARDYNGHGTHTSSTAGGNNGVQATGPGAVFGKISGMAPRANIAMYKALWSTEDASTASGYTSDLVAAIDQAVADGVDVINYSVSGSQTNFRDPVEIAFLYAAEAGVFVAASAGNSGPATSTVAHPSPWITTVAAGTHNRSGEGSVTLGNGVTYYGASLATAVTASLIDSTAAGVTGADPTALALCYAAIDNGGTAVLDPAKVAGKIIVCDRGTNARVNKSLAVMEAGGVGMILLNTSSNSLNADFHYVPTVHLQNTDRAAVKAYAATAGATATINLATITYTTPAPYTASFSSRGPLKASGDLLKPDLIAPGQDILAAVSPASSGGLDFNLYSGTSMSSPHVAGLAALLKQLHPRWTPMMIKSALMTTAYDVLDGPNTNPLVIFRQGAGHVKPNSAADPGLVFNSRWNDWMGFLCGTQLPTSFCTSSHPAIPVLDPSDFNAPSIAIADLAGTQTVTRTVTNVGKEKSTYNVTVTGLTGLTVNVSPATFSLHPGQRQKLQITITQSSAALNAYTGGYLTWADGKHTVRIPVVVKPVAMAAPREVSGSYNVTFGYTGTFTAAARGLVAAQTFTDSVNTGEYYVYDVTIPAGTTYARFSLFDANTTPGSDLDLYVYDGALNLIGSSAGGTSQEEVNFLNPAADTYWVLVDGYATANPSTFTLFAWVLGSIDAGNMTVSAPASATLGTTAAINLSFSGLTAGTKYLGSVAYGGIAGLPNPTIVRVDP